MEDKYYREDIIIEFNGWGNVWEISVKDTGEFIGEAKTLIELINKFEWLN